MADDTKPFSHHPMLKVGGHIMAEILGLNTPPQAGAKVHKTEAEWRGVLTPEQFQVLRGKGTERALRESCTRITRTACTTAAHAPLRYSPQTQSLNPGQVAELFSTGDTRCGRGDRGQHPWNAAGRSGVRHVRISSGARFSGWTSRPDRLALLHQLGFAAICRGRGFESFKDGVTVWSRL